MKNYYDVHTHFLPGVDDGAKDRDETRALLEREYQDGVRKIYLTTHYRRGMFEPEMGQVLRAFEETKQTARTIGEDLEVFLGCEFHANQEMTDMLDRKERPCMGDSRCVLIEFSDRWSRREMRERCYMLQSHGYQPIIAHAERYESVRKHPEFLEEMTDMGVYIQMNADSILGKEGFFMKRFCKKMLRQGVVHLIGSDGHNMKDRKPSMGACASYLEKLLGQEEAEKLLIENPRMILEEGK